MKYLIYTIIATFLFGNVNFCLNPNYNTKRAIDSIPIIKSNKKTISIRDGHLLKLNGWNLTPEAKPDIYEVSIKNGNPTRVEFYTDTDSISFSVTEGQSYDFIILWNNQKCYQRVIGTKFVSAANFSKSYINNNIGKISVKIPKVYELINIAMAISKFGRENPYRIYQRSQYYGKVMNWFEPFKNQKLIQQIDSLMASNSFNYANVKMNANAFEFNSNGKIVRSSVFDRTGFRNQKSNYLLPFIEAMQSFSDRSKFLIFYKNNIKTYNSQLNVYKDSIGISGMQNWLDKNFPQSNGFDFYNVIFSPLVSYHQSSTWFENNGFKELQPHVNFPYKRDLRKLLPLSKKAEYVFRGNIVFTELNHGYINPYGEKFKNLILKATSNRNIWVDESKGSNYYNDINLFNEYMNWGLISLRIIDEVPQDEQKKLTDRIEVIMSKNRGFPKFVEFNQFLMDLYMNRVSNTPVSALYPSIIEWFDTNN